MLLTEYRPFQVDKKLAEAALKENKAPFTVKGIIQRAEAKNQNGRVYPREILEREIEKYINGPVREKRALGELDHPESSVINLQNQNIIIQNLLVLLLYHLLLLVHYPYLLN